MAKQKIDIVVSAKDKASRKFGSIAKAALGMGAAFLSFRAIKSVIAGSVAAYNQQEQAEQKLASALKATGNAAGFSFDQLKAYSSQLQKMTIYGDESIMEMQSLLATFRNVHGEVFTEATGLVLDMSHALGQDLKSSAIMVGKALNDPAVGLTAMSRAGITFSDEQKNVIKQLQATGDIAGAQKLILAELTNQFGGQAAAAANTFGGALKQLSNAWGDTKEQMGQMIANIPGFATGIQFAKTVMENFGLSMDIVWTQTALGLVRFWEDIKHFFGSTIPAVLVWFKDNWKVIFTDIWNGTKSIFLNMFKNAKNFFSALWSWIKGDGFDFKWTGLLEGFEATLTEMPDIVKRNKSDLEKALELELGGLTEQFNKDLADNLNGHTAAAPTPGAAGAGAGAGASLAAAAKAGKIGNVEARFLSGAMTGEGYQQKTANNTDKIAKGIDKLTGQLARILQTGGGSETTTANIKRMRMA